MTVCAFRIVRQEQADAGFDGEGARLFGGRWNAKGTRMVYSSATLSLAILEMLVHLESRDILSRRYCFRTARFDEALCETLGKAQLPAGWNDDVPINATRDLGDAWVREGRTAVLSVPSALSPDERNYLLNPAHPDFTRIRLGAARPFEFSKRLPKD